MTEIEMFEYTQDTNRLLDDMQRELDSYKSTRENRDTLIEARIRVNESNIKKSWAGSIQGVQDNLMKHVNKQHRSQSEAIGEVLRDQLAEIKKDFRIELQEGRRSYQSLIALNEAHALTSAAVLVAAAAEFTGGANPYNEEANYDI